MQEMVIIDRQFFPIQMIQCFLRIIYIYCEIFLSFTGNPFNFVRKKQRSGKKITSASRFNKVTIDVLNKQNGDFFR